MKKELKKNYKDIFVECPRCNNYFSLEQLAEILERNGVKEKTIKQIYDDIAGLKLHDIFELRRL